MTVYTTSRVQCTHHLFERECDQHPEAVALECPAAGTWLSYAELNRHANSLARSLRGLRIEPGTIVGVFLPNIPVRIVTRIAIHKAGAAYALLDPNYPKAYLECLFRSTSFRLVVTDRPYLERIPTGAGRTVCLGAIIEKQDDQDAHLSEFYAEPGDIAYIAFTSGSTGHPKGVAIPHRASLNHITAVSQAYGLTASDRVSLCASPAFDMTVEEIFSTLGSGGTVVILPDGALEADQLSATVAEHRLTVLNLPASLWHRWVNVLLHTQARVPESLRLLVVGSEAIFTARLKEWLMLPGADHVRWMAAYGLTETAVTTLLFQYEPSMPLPTTPLVPIGRPIQGVETWVLGDHATLAGVEEPGHLYIGGICLATEYVNDPILTAQKFRSIHLPGRHSGALRLFETGDRACWLPDGNLAFLGRTDDLLKWHGFRIEPGEIEQALYQHPEIREAVVVLGGSAEEPTLVAYVVPRSPSAGTSHDLRGFLQELLPAAKVLSHIRARGHLPLTPSGKIDRRALSEALEGGAVPGEETT